MSLQVGVDPFLEKIEQKPNLYLRDIDAAMFPTQPSQEAHDNSEQQVKSLNDAYRCGKKYQYPKRNLAAVMMLLMPVQ